MSSDRLQSGDDDAEVSRTSVSGDTPGSGERRVLPDFSGHNIGGRFRIDSVLAEGGMSRVFVAYQVGLERRVAIKMLKPPPDESGAMWLERFKREAAVLASLSHPNLVVVHEFGEYEGYPYLAMELVEGTTASSVVREHGAVEPRRLVGIAKQIAAGLEEAHARGVIHRDLKPSNVLLMSRDRVKVIDFGIAKAIDRDAERTRDDVLLGSPRYMAPEQAQNKAISPATDVYALGCVLYYMAVGAPPFNDAGAVAVMLAHVNTPAVPPRTAHPTCAISAEFEAVILRCLRKAPDERYPSMLALLDALAATPEGGRVDVASSPARAAVPRGGRRPRWLVPAMLAATGAIVAAAALPFQHSRPRAQRTAAAPRPRSTAPAPAAPASTPAPSAAAPAPVAAVPAPPADRVVVVLDSVPSGARVARAGVVLGNTPVSIPLARSERALLQVSQTGFEPATVELNDVELAPIVRLVRVPTRGARAAPTRAAAPRPAETPPAARRPPTDNLNPWEQ